MKPKSDILGDEEIISILFTLFPHQRPRDIINEFYDVTVKNIETNIVEGLLRLCYHSLYPVNKDGFKAMYFKAVWYNPIFWLRHLLAFTGKSIGHLIFIPIIHFVCLIYCQCIFISKELKGCVRFIQKDTTQLKMWDRGKENGDVIVYNYVSNYDI